MNEIQKYAISYSMLGFHILALGIQAKQPHKKLAPKGLYSATNDYEIIENWFKQDSRINIGIACRASGIVVLDVDLRNGGTTDGLPMTRRIHTGNGFHYYYTADPISVFPGKYREGIDIKWNGYVVAVPSLHPSGVNYQVENEMPMQPIGDLVGAR